mmetsp:Transcript_10217/g.31550  ORF Transcript_10217/g.31550 Transcript_10217/m.31550 type:complete len:96 (+) Transcript_10217:1060-1347(+)
MELPPRTPTKIRADARGEQPDRSAPCRMAIVNSAMRLTPACAVLSALRVSVFSGRRCRNANAERKTNYTVPSCEDGNNETRRRGRRPFPAIMTSV